MKCALRLRRAAAGTAAALLLMAAAAHAAMPVRDPDWPCQQIKVPRLSLGALWDGPDVAPYESTWSQDAAVAALAGRIVQRRMPLDQAQQAIRGFAASAGPQRQPQLLALMAGVFSLLDGQRSQVIAGLDRFGARQKQLAAEIVANMDKLRAEPAEGGDVAPVRPGDLSDQIGWQTRVFEQRRQAISYACGVPDAIEQRLFALARTISASLGPATP